MNIRFACVCFFNLIISFTLGHIQASRHLPARYNPRGPANPTENSLYNFKPAFRLPIHSGNYYPNQIHLPPKEAWSWRNLHKHLFSKSSQPNRKRIIPPLKRSPYRLYAAPTFMRRQIDSVNDTKVLPSPLGLTTAAPSSSTPTPPCFVRRIFVQNLKVTWTECEDKSIPVSQTLEIIEGEEHSDIPGTGSQLGSQDLQSAAEFETFLEKYQKENGTLTPEVRSNIIVRLVKAIGAALEQTRAQALQANLRRPPGPPVLAPGGPVPPPPLPPSVRVQPRPRPPPASGDNIQNPRPAQEVETPQSDANNASEDAERPQNIPATPRPEPPPGASPNPASVFLNTFLEIGTLSIQFITGGIGFSLPLLVPLLGREFFKLSSFLVNNTDSFLLLGQQFLRYTFNLDGVVEFTCPIFSQYDGDPCRAICFCPNTTCTSPDNCNWDNGFLPPLLPTLGCTAWDICNWNCSNLSFDLPSPSDSMSNCDVLPSGPVGAQTTSTTTVGPPY